MVKLQVRRRRKTRPARERRTPSTRQKVLGWLVHAYTATGMVFAGLIAVLLVRGNPADFRMAFLLMVVATLVDATDGTFARKVRIKEAVPGFDGRRLDDIIDFLTYTFLPVGLIWRAGILPPGYEPWLFLPLLASLYGFCQVQAKTDDGYFLGFPSLWNVVAIYVYALPFGPWVSLAIVTTLAVMTFVPSKYLYPSLPGAFNRLVTILSIPWTITLGWLIYKLPTSPGETFDPTTTIVAWASLSYPILYLGASWVITVAHWTRPRPAADSEAAAS
jgi:phosphatidylcholine synthase